LATAQPGIFALGSTAHCYLEFDLRTGGDPDALIRAVAGLDEPRTTVGGANFVVGFRPELWNRVATEHVLPAVHGFEQPVPGVDGFAMPATQHDAWVWVAGSARDLVFDVSAGLVSTLAPAAALATEVTGWPYLHSRDLTGFEDGTENPTLSEAPGVAVLPEGGPGAGSSVVLVQQWAHNSELWNSLGVADQELVMGRTKADSVELDDERKPADSHVARTVIEEDGEELDIFRRNTPYGTVTEHGTMFVGFSRDQVRLHRMLERMAGAEDGIRDALTRYTTPLTGAYYVIPPVEALLSLA
jgi:porphyrinogen peroxidase